MTPEQFTSALAALHWKQSDFCRKTGTDKSTPSNWTLGKTPIPLWVDAYLGAMQDLAALHTKYLATKQASGDSDDQPFDIESTSVSDLDATVQRITAKRRPGRPRKNAM